MWGHTLGVVDIRGFPVFHLATSNVLNMNKVGQVGEWGVQHKAECHSAAATRPACNEMTWYQTCGGGWVCEWGRKLQLQLEWGLV